MTFVDTHTHLNDSVYENGGEEMVRKALAAGVVMMILPGTSLSELTSMKALAARFPDNVRMFAGLHPTELTDNPHAALEIIRQELDTPGLPYVGVGEIGIDLHEDKAHRDIQMECFDIQCLLKGIFPLTYTVAMVWTRLLKSCRACLICLEARSIVLEVLLPMWSGYVRQEIFISV